jgi:hypothetical protein
MGISPIGWLHTLGSLPAIPLAIYMLMKHGRIAPETTAGRAYFTFMLLGALTVYPIAHQPVSSIIATITLALLLVGYGLSLLPRAARGLKYVETIALSITAFLLFVPSVSETLRRLPVGNPIAKGLNDPILLGAQGLLFLALVVGVALQVRVLYKRGAPASRALETRA